MKKTYQIPSVITMQLMPSTVVLAGSPTTLPILPPIPGEGD